MCRSHWKACLITFCKIGSLRQLTGLFDLSYGYNFNHSILEAMHEIVSKVKKYVSIVIP